MTATPTSSKFKDGFPPIEECLPHSRKMLLPTRVVSLDHENLNGVVEMSASTDMPYFRDGRFLPHWAIEIMAQSVGAVYILSTKTVGGKPKPSFLISVDNYELLDSSREVRDGDLFTVNVNHYATVYPVAKFECDVLVGGKLYCQAEMKFLEKEVT